ncbi:PilZ domain-containing protein [Shewanella intestini]|uniref:Cyclic diguanosine monophosphate-binding protein n=1 Tax=Shewanella intestini TaxID=2017544 RepID=A0ABS5HZF9_9GAMM|nr:MULTISPECIES: PilZ domain-containing protein [Shewanella]MBR9726490.1 PilZ domain-containing protein [Shewanella intestini]MRG34944.1 PilZ domain-containing protein [Shewanella sp. XMDDZSB0408]
MDERRKFSRILFGANAYIALAEQTWKTTILDLSLNGALIKRPNNFVGKLNTLLKLEFVLPDSEVQLVIDAMLIHKTPEHLGLKCVHIDVESISHLRRIIELNIGDAELLNREIEMLAALNET